MRYLALFIFIFSFSSCAGALKNSEKPTEGLSISLVQYEVEGSLTFPEFIRKVESQIQAAQRVRSKFVIFPEFVTLDMYEFQSSDETNSQKIKKLASRFDAYMNELTRMAKLYNLTILGGSTPRETSRGLMNVAPLVFPDGRVAFQEKIFLTSWEKQQGFKAGSELRILQSPWGNLIIFICSDVTSPYLSDMLSDWNPSLILVPSMTKTFAAEEQIRRTAQARAIEHHAYVLVSSNVGAPSKDWQMYGRSSVFSPQDEIFEGLEKSTSARGDGLLNFSISLNDLETSRRGTDFWPSRDSSAKRNMIRVRAASMEKWKSPVPTLR